MKDKESLSRAVIYQVFVRNHSERGTLQAVREDLPRLQGLGVDIIQLLPVHPIGIKGRKGTMGSPYAIRDYRAISPDLGTLDDLKSLFEDAHRLGMKVIMDMVFNHTARDAIYLENHEDWYYHDPKGRLANKVGDWSDVYDLDHTNPELREFLIHDVLAFYVKMGCDGFRFDVGSLLPRDFFLETRKALDPINDNLFFLCEAVDTGFLLWSRGQGIPCLSNGELIDCGFDAVYHYASWPWLSRFLTEKDPVALEQYKAAFNVEMAESGSNAFIARAIENHDQPRIASYGNERFTKELLRFSFFTKGPAFVYAGEEIGAKHKPELFEKDPVDWKERNPAIETLVKELIQEKHRQCGLRTSEAIPSERGTIAIRNTYVDKEVTETFDFRP